ncbi:hypothetical protein RA28_11405 [Ruegeria sp. ANG-S4]|nr:hypothetical protein RA28_11405 [Ruegeria sp. ANG-S4]
MRTNIEHFRNFFKISADTGTFRALVDQPVPPSCDLKPALFLRFQTQSKNRNAVFQYTTIHNPEGRRAKGGISLMVWSLAKLKRHFVICSRHLASGTEYQRQHTYG